MDDEIERPVPDVRPVWAECARVLRAGGNLLAGFTNPVRYLFPYDIETDSYDLRVSQTIPFSDVDTLTDEEKARFIQEGEPFEFGHTLEDQIAGQLEAGFVLTGFYEDSCPAGADELSEHIATFIATRARRAGP